MFTHFPSVFLCLARLSAKMALLACFAVAFRRGSTSTVTAFSLATFGAKVAATSSSARNSFSGSARRHAFLSRNQFRTSAASSIALHQSTLVATNELLEKSLEVTHPAYDVIEKDVVSEYGAYCTLYRHKKSGAELLSVSVDDDNKVRVVIMYVSWWLETYD